MTAMALHDRTIHSNSQCRTVCVHGEYFETFTIRQNCPEVPRGHVQAMFDTSLDKEV